GILQKNLHSMLGAFLLTK
ncbi:hypothetical protein CISIN_1g0067132mg, partial [Citrus sinensis]